MTSKRDRKAARRELPRLYPAMPACHFHVAHALTLAPLLDGRPDPSERRRIVEVARAIRATALLLRQWPY